MDPNRRMDRVAAHSNQIPGRKSSATMKAMFQRILLLTFLFFAPVILPAQGPEMADGMRQEGKIYVVVAIVLTVAIGLIVYLFIIDRKVSRLEKDKGL